jgi:uncharacterized protein (DUF111 family)
MIHVATRFGTVCAKVARRPNGRVTIAPEYDDCKRAAELFQVPLQVVWVEALEKARAHIDPMS